MAFRLFRICDKEDTLEKILDELKKVFLIPRNYSSKQKKSNRIIGVFDYNPLLPKISTILTKHHHTMISKNLELLEVFPKPLMAALHQGPNFRKHLCKAKLTKVTRKCQRAAHRSFDGWKCCSSSGGNPCNRCPYSPTLQSQSNHT